MRSRSRSAWTRLVLAALLTSVGSQAGAAPPPPQQNLPKPLGYVSDYAGVLTEEWESRIRSVCKDLERRTGVEMVVVTTPSIEPYLQAKEYATALFAYWKIGSAQNEHGVMVLSYPEGRQASVTLGRNMIRVVPPSRLEEITRSYVEPAFQVGKFGEGLYRAAVALASTAQDVRVGASPRRRSGAAGFWMMVGTVVIVVWFFWWIARPEKRHPFRRVQRGEFWASGAGGFGGNFGGFGGATSGEGFN